MFVGPKQNYRENICLLLVLAPHPLRHHYPQLHLLLHLVLQQEREVEGQVPGHCNQRHQGTDNYPAIEVVDREQEFQDAKNPDDLTHQEKVHKYLGTMAPTKFFFLYALSIFACKFIMNFRPFQAIQRQYL